MSEAHAAKLASLTRCPCCRAGQVELEIRFAPRAAAVAFACGSAFVLSHGQIIVSAPCQTRTRLAAELMNVEATGKLQTATPRFGEA